MDGIPLNAGIRAIVDPAACPSLRKQENRNRRFSAPASISLQAIATSTRHQIPQNVVQDAAGLDVVELILGIDAA